MLRLAAEMARRALAGGALASGALAGGALASGALASGVLAQGATGGSSTIGVPLRDLTVRASLARTTVAVGASLPLALHVRLTTRAPRSRSIPDPRQGGDAMTLHLRAPDGAVRSFTTGEALATPGVRRPVTGMQVVPGRTRTITLDLARLTPLRTRGAYALVVSYRPHPGGAAWTSDTLRFTVTDSVPSRGTRPPARSAS